MLRELLDNLAAALSVIDGSPGYVTRAGEVIQLGGTVTDRPETDQIVIRMPRKDYSSRVNGETLSFATAATSVCQTGVEFQVIGACSQIYWEQPGQRMADLLGDLERALMKADKIKAGGKNHTIQLVSADFDSRADGANAETVTLNIRLSGTQAWQSN